MNIIDLSGEKIPIYVDIINNFGENEKIKIADSSVEFFELVMMVCKYKKTNDESVLDLYLKHLSKAEKKKRMLAYKKKMSSLKL